MSERQDPDTFIDEVDQLRDELVYTDKVIHDDSILEITLEGLTDEYVHMKCSAETENDFSFDQTVVATRMRDMYANRRIMRDGPSRKVKRRESAMITCKQVDGKIIFHGTQ